MNRLFLIKITYLKEMKEVEAIRPLHREYLKNGYKDKKLLLSGPHKEFEGQFGGIIIGKFNDISEANDFAKNDPFYLNKIAKYEILEFEVPLYDNVLDKYFNNER